MGNLVAPRHCQAMLRETIERHTKMKLANDGEDGKLKRPVAVSSSPVRGLKRTLFDIFS